jgi:calcineurin-like phosphoesterase family protein
VAVLCLQASLWATAPANGTPPPKASITSGVTIGAVGDMACDTSDRAYNGGAGTSSACGERSTSAAMQANSSLTLILGLGDYQYDCGAPADWTASYDPTWGRLDYLMDPAAGNHEYITGRDAFGAQCPTSNATAQGYFNHFGAAAHQGTGGHYSFNVGSWHVIALNGNCGHTGVGGCGATSPQTVWLKHDLAANSSACTLAYWHQPLFTGIGTGKNPAYQAWWNALYADHADVVLNGHIHNYQRFGPKNPSGAADARGITEYVVGTGGESQVSVKAAARPQPVVWKRAFGYLQMTLQPGGWTAKFISAARTVLDSSSGTCS